MRVNSDGERAESVVRADAQGLSAFDASAEGAGEE